MYVCVWLRLGAWVVVCSWLELSFWPLASPSATICAASQMGRVCVCTNVCT